MSNPFDNVPSSANLPETPDKKDIANLAELVSRIEDATRCFEASAKSSEELAGAVFEALLDDDGTMKDFGHACEIRMMLRDEATIRAIFHDRLERQLDSIPTSIDATLSEDDRKRLDDNFKSWSDVFRLHLPKFGIVGLVVGICIMVNWTAGMRTTPKPSPSDNSTARTSQSNTATGKPAVGNKTSPTATPSATPTPLIA